MPGFRKFLVLVLPMFVIFAWAGCIAVCAEDTAGHKISVEITGESETEIAPECQKICRLGNTLAVLERHNVTAPAAGCAPVRVSRFSIPALPSNIQTPCVNCTLPPKAQPLNSRPGNLRI
jgi:hypothetical protein